MPLFGAIEAGGTKFICGVGTGPDDLRTVRIPTTGPDATVAQAIAWLRDQGELQAIGIGSFGPVELNRNSPRYGHITSTPKVEWRNYNLAGAVKSALKVPVGFDTDVNAAILGEARWGAAHNVANALYLTIGTGIGGGALVSGKLLHGVSHPEMGHIRIPHDLASDPFTGICPFHGDCLEGLASGPAIHARWNTDPPADHPAWPLEAKYLAYGIAAFASILSPEVVLLGGGVMQQPQLLEMIRAELAKVLGGYIPTPELLPPQLGERAGILGALALAQITREG
jgi:fructokinase